MLKVSFYCKIRKKDDPTAQIRADGSNMTLICVGQGASGMIRAGSHQMDHNTGLHAELSTGSDFDTEAAPINAGWC